MPSSTSSFERPQVRLPWYRWFALALVVLAVSIWLMEHRLAQLGYKPTIPDTVQSWKLQRARASALGDRALIIIGASRIQLGVNLDVLRHETGLEPVQLAIDGSSSMAILKGLASDPSIRGTVLIDYYDHNLGAPIDVAEKVQREYEEGEKAFGAGALSQKAEAMLTDAVRSNLLSYADGANPWNSFWKRIVPSKPAELRAYTKPDRSKMVDYSKADAGNYLTNVMARLGKRVKIDANVHAALAREVGKLVPDSNQGFVRNVQEVKRQVDAIRARGGRVFLVAMPSSGMVKEIENRRYPREMYWSLALKEIGVPGIHTNDHPAFIDFYCPDGSHLDYRDQERFTALLVRELKLKEAAGARSGDKASQ